MKKRDLKKLALLGITGGIMMVSQSAQADITEGAGQLLAFNGCGGRHGCGNVADNYQPSGGSCGGRHGCGGSGSGSSSSYGQQTQGYYNSDYGQQAQNGSNSSGGQQAQSGCNSSDGQQAQSSCNSHASCHSNAGQAHPQSHCGAQSGGCQSSNGQQSNGKNEQAPSGYYYQPQQQQSTQQSFNTRNGRYYTAEADTAEKAVAPEAAPAKTLTKEELKAQLTEQGKSMFDRLSPEGQALAIKLASQSCKGHNDCKGMNSCKSDKNACAGQGGCKGQGSCSFKDKDKAVKVAALKMAEKRASLNNGAGK